MKFLLNGQSVIYDGDPELPLLTYLRETAGIISPKDGCAPQAACGCCAVQLDDKAVLACVIPMKKVDGGTVTTIEGLGEYRQNVFANAFVSKGGVQCGFCIPGIVIQANVLIGKNPQPSRDEIEHALTPHLCRCTGYKKIVDAVACAAEAIRHEEDVLLPESLGKVGDRLPKYQAQDLVLGQHQYVDDISLPGMLHGALKFSDHPRAVVRRIDTRGAAATPGVVRVLTAGDIPGERNVGLVERDWPMMVAEGETTRYIGDVLALVVADTEQTARAAVEKIEIEYEVLAPLTDMFAALEPDAPRIHAAGNTLSRTVTNRGDVAAARKGSAFISRGQYQTQWIEHGFMEPECAIGVRTEDGVEVYSQGQGVFEDRDQIADMLGLPKKAVRVRMVPNGGGFGGKEDLSTQGHAALAAWHLGMPVKVKFNRDESINFHPKRHPVWMDYEVGCDPGGKLTFVKVKFVGDTGAYASVGMKVLERSAGHATGAYAVPVTDVEALAVYTNNIPCGAMRGFGVNQAAFGLESCIDNLCEQGGFDPWQFRFENALQDGDMTATGQVIESGAGACQTLLAVKDAYDAARAAGKFIGLGCGIKNTGIGNGMPDSSQVRVTIEAPDRVVIDHGWTEMGQGVNTIAIQTLVTETGLPPDIVRVRIGTAAEQEAGMTTASRATSLLGNALIDAGRKLRADLEAYGTPTSTSSGGGDSLAEPVEARSVRIPAALIGKIYGGEWTVNWTTKPGAMVEKVYTHYSYSYATQMVILDADGQLEKVVAAHDAGKIFNPTLFEGQLEGSIHMGLGYAISESLEMEGGRPKSTRLRQMGILRAKEMPDMEIIGVEVPDPYGPYGAKGVGEIGLVPTAGAVANALFQFDGVRRTTLPMKLPKKKR